MPDLPPKDERNCFPETTGKTSKKHTAIGVLVAVHKKEKSIGIGKISLVDFDTVFGHRRNTAGYAEAVMRLDAWLKDFIRGLREDDILMITADHGCDPDYKGTDHTRENVPLLVYGKAIKPVNIGERESFSDIAATIADLFGIPYDLNGKSFKEVILK